MVEATCGIPFSACSSDNPIVIGTPSELTCVLEALRDRTPGVLGWNFDGLTRGEDGYVVVFEGGSALVGRAGNFDYDYYSCEAMVGSLPEPSYFASCLQNPDVNMRFACLSFDVVTPEGVCQGGRVPCPFNGA